MSKTKETDPALAAIGKAPSGDKKEKSLEEWSTEKEFIYGGPFVKQETPSPLLGTATPINLQLQGTFKKSFAYYSLKERMPVILTKVIDYCSREGAKIKSATGGSDEDLRNFIQYVTKLKNDLVTNKKYDLLTVDTPEAKRWNEWIQNAQNSYYFTNTWVFTECYIYRRLREGAELQKGLQTFDPFDEQKEKAFKSCMEPMCIVAEKVAAMLPESDKDKKKADFMTLVKICLWANKCDLSLSMGEQVNLKGETASAAKKDAATNTGDSAKATADSAKATADSAKATADPTKATADAKPTAEPSKDSKGSASATDKSATPVNTAVMDPIQMIVDYKDKVLVDDSGKAFDAITAKAETMAKAIEGNTTFKFQCSCHRLATLYGLPLAKEPSKPADAAAEPSKASTGSSPPTSSPPTSSSPPTTTSAPTPGSPAAEEAPKIPCPAKMVLPQSVIYDIVCDNAGYELFADLCLAHFLIAQKIVQKVRFHVKKIPWFVSDVTPRDFKYVIAQCRAASFNREVPAEPKPDAAPDAPPEPPRVIGSSSLKTLADQWQAYVDDGTFIVMSDDFWTSPHVFKDMKQYDYNLYRKLQYAVGIMFKGDLNYRKLLGERNCNPTLGFEPALQGFIPAPILAVRTVKADLICALPKGRFEQLNKLDEKWMQKGDYGVISFCGKAEPLKVSDRPCLDYGDKCFSVVCPIHKDM